MCATMPSFSFPAPFRVIYFYFCVWVFYLLVCLCTIGRQCLRRWKEGSGSSRTGVAGHWEPPCRYWESHWFLRTNISTLKHWAIAPTPHLFLTKAIYQGIKICAEDTETPTVIMYSADDGSEGIMVRMAWHVSLAVVQVLCWLVQQIICSQEVHFLDNETQTKRSVLKP